MRKLKLITKPDNSVEVYSTKNIVINIVYRPYTTNIIVDINNDLTMIEACYVMSKLLLKISNQDGDIPFCGSDEEQIIRKVLDGERNFTI